ncbi:Protein SQS1 [Colletotrichum chlorophyti]|uniref:Protein SQS1 n=1 Tax=Colletotrichum chlorophyti TaxID=708187 RepID=A0A1Q8RTU9_9PEZI|nr:Protein SQS1 [Colletotrichum chlorophyti]
MPRGGKRGGARAPLRNAQRLQQNRGVDLNGSSPASAGGATGKLPASLRAHTNEVSSIGFTLQDEARTTAHRSSVWNSDSRLRHRPVTFVSTGSIEPLKQLEEEILQQESFSQLEKATPQPEPITFESPHDPLSDEITSTSGEAPLHDVVHTGVVDGPAKAPQDEELRMAPASHLHQSSSADIETLSAESTHTTLPFVLDVTGDRQKHQDKRPIRVQTRSPSPAASDSSEEVILFKGRKKTSTEKQRPFNLRGIRTEIKVVEKTVKSPERHCLLPTITAKHGFEALSDDENDIDVPEVEEESESSDAELQLDCDKLKGSKRRKAGQHADTFLEGPERAGSYFTSLELSNAGDASPKSGTSGPDEPEDELFNEMADRFANEVDDFDFMDWNRPVLKHKKGKGAKGKVPIFDISDEELEYKMHTAWKNDRLKKAERKRERQALRAQGLLGKHANPEDLRVKYPHGMGLDQIAEELKNFLLGTQPSLTLPPMDNHARKVIHELASKFNIKSKSTGSGDQRRPMLHRSFRTTKYAEETFDMAIARRCGLRFSVSQHGAPAVADMRAFNIGMAKLSEGRRRS